MGVISISGAIVWKIKSKQFGHFLPSTSVSNALAPTDLAYLIASIAKHVRHLQIKGRYYF
jgi:hypothetical protein